MTFRKNHIIPLVLSGFFFFLDQTLKYIARTNPHDTFHIIKNIFGWEYFGNPGIAFSLPFPNTVLVIGTPIILLLLLEYLSRRRTVTKKDFLAASLIFFGAISNLIDRVLFELTIDYIRIFTSVINIADVMIVLGTIFFLFGAKEDKGLSSEASAKED